jgi:hypothetical protein
MQAENADILLVVVPHNGPGAQRAPKETESQASGDGKR